MFSGISILIYAYKMVARSVVSVVTQSYKNDILMTFIVCSSLSKGGNTRVGFHLEGLKDVYLKNFVLVQRKTLLFRF